MCPVYDKVVLITDGCDIAVYSECIVTIKTNHQRGTGQ